MRSYLLSQGFIQLDFENLHGRRLHNLSRQQVPLLDWPHSEKCLIDIDLSDFSSHLPSLVLSPCSTVMSVASRPWKPPRRCWKGTAKPSLLQAPQQEQFLCLSSQGKSSHLKTIFIALHWTHPSLSTPPLSWGAVQLDAIFWMQSNECWVVGNNRFTWPSGCAPVNTAHTAAPCLACCPARPPGLSQQSCSPARLSQAVLVQGVTPARKQSQEAPPLNSCLNGKFA